MGEIVWTKFFTDSATLQAISVVEQAYIPFQLRQILAHQTKGVLAKMVSAEMDTTIEEIRKEVGKQLPKIRKTNAKVKKELSQKIVQGRQNAEGSEAL